MGLEGVLGLTGMMVKAVRSKTSVPKCVGVKGGEWIGRLAGRFLLMSSSHSRDNGLLYQREKSFR
jgi:hypothetical protein